MAHKTLVGGTAYEIKGGKTLVNGTAYEISNGKTLVGGTKYDISFFPKIGSLPVGSSVFMNFNTYSNGIESKEFIVVQQGKPSAMYDDSCEGTWLWAKTGFGDYYDGTFSAHNADSNDYAKLQLHTLILKSTVLAKFDSAIQSIIKDVKIPYHNGTGRNGSISSGSNGLSTKLFALSAVEVGVAANNYTPADGSCLSYFSSNAAERRKTGVGWLRSPYLYSDSELWAVSSDGSIFHSTVRASITACGAFVLPSSTFVSLGSDNKWHVLT